MAANPGNNGTIKPDSHMESALQLMADGRARSPLELQVDLGLGFDETDRVTSQLRSQGLALTDDEGRLSITREGRAELVTVLTIGARLLSEST